MLCMTFHSHDYQMFRKAWGTYELIKDMHGFVLGGMEGTVFQDYELQMNYLDLFISTMIREREHMEKQIREKKNL